MLVPPSLRVERAAGDLRRGLPILIEGRRSQSSLALAAETATPEILAQVASRFGAPFLLLTHSRAKTLKIPLYTDDVVALRQTEPLDLARIRAIADPASDLDYPMKGPFSPHRGDLPPTATAAVALAKLAGLLPAVLFFVLDKGADDNVRAEAVLTSVTAGDILSFSEDAAETLVLVTRARVPLDGAEDSELVAFRPRHGGPEHLAVVIGKSTAPALQIPGPVLIRIHSECFTGDFLGSLKCDCGDQLRGAVREIAQQGGGILLYLAQEGRGIGLMNKLRAYRLQDEGFDTVDANTRLGFEADERLYDAASRMLKLMGYESVRLMTNNPEKMKALEKSGIRVVERVSHAFPDNPHNRAYLRTKADRGGHFL